jgi:hypothetical protein
MASEGSEYAESAESRKSGLKPVFEDDLTSEEETRGIMKLAEASLAEFLNDEPDIYTLKDLINRP